MSNFMSNNVDKRPVSSFKKFKLTYYLIMPDYYLWIHLFLKYHDEEFIFGQKAIFYLQGVHYNTGQFLDQVVL